MKKTTGRRKEGRVTDVEWVLSLLKYIVLPEEVKVQLFHFLDKTSKNIPHRSRVGSVWKLGSFSIVPWPALP